MPKLLSSGSNAFREKVIRLRTWLRRVMPRVAIAAAILLILRLLFGRTFLYGNHAFGNIFGFCTFVVVFVTVVYYGVKILRWVKRKLFWRVRRRLVVTYLFVGLTPIVLLTLLGLLAAFGGSNQAMARLVTVQLGSTERQTLSSARALANDLARLSTNDDREAQTWINDRVQLLRASLPGVRVAVWRGAVNEDGSGVGIGTRSSLVSDVSDDDARGVGSSVLAIDEPLPEWLRGRADWSGLSFIAPPTKEEPFATPSIRAMARATANGRPATVLLVVPISRSLVQQFRDLTGIYLRPFFLNSGIRQNDGNFQVNVDEDGETNSARTKSAEKSGERMEATFRKDQFGEPINGTAYVVVGEATNWISGVASSRLIFLFDWSWTVASKQFLSGGDLGRVWQQAFKIVAFVFLIFELVALIAAAWMTRAVTGTVHKLYRATEYIRRGDFSHRVAVRSPDQLGELATAFNEMSSNIESLLQERVIHERLEREVEIAAEVQARLFPGRVPELMSVELAAECRAARGVAGDYYDYIQVAPGIVALALGDVSGKGVSASLVMANLQASLRAQAAITAERLSIAERAIAASTGGDGSKALARVVADADMDGAVARKATNINRQLCLSTDANRFATLFIALYEDRTRILRYTNAGHNAPVLVRADGTAERLSTGGMMVGAFEWAQYEEARTTLERGELLLIFSDGISEAGNDEGEEYGEERLIDFAIRHRSLSAHDLRQALFNEIDAWSGQTERGDDQTLLIVKALS